MTNEFQGVIPSKYEPSHYNIAQFVPNVDKVLGERFSLNLPQQELVIDQGETSSCVGHSLATANAIAEYQNLNKWFDFSPFFTYGDRGAKDYKGIGMMPKQALSCVYKRGMWFRSDFDKNVEVPALFELVKLTKEKNPQLVKQALNYRISGYAWLGTDDDIKIALKNNMPVTASWQLYSSFSITDKTGCVPVPNLEKDVMRGSHQMTIIGWTDDHWMVINSWGLKKAFKGLYLIPFVYRPLEAWSISSTIDPYKLHAREVKLHIGQRQIIVDDVVTDIDVAPFLADSRTYIPVRVLTEALGASVEWIEATEEVFIRRAKTLLKLKIGSPEAYVNGSKYMLDAAPVLVDCRTMLPVRFIAEHLDYSVAWDRLRDRITISR